MSQDDEPGASTPPLDGGTSSRKGVLRRLLDGLAPASRAAAPGRLGRYRILHRLGQGGMGVVFAAEDSSLGRRVAVKTITEPDESARKRFRREARAAAGVNHPNVCQVYEIGEDGGQLFIAMELLDGESLTDRLARGPLPMAEAVALGRGILGALQALHATGVVHRDLKPSNVFLTTHGVKLLDFGLARPLPRELTQSLETGTELTRPGLLVGTPRYMAPEQVLGHEVDARTDLFAAAAILYEAVSGRPAFLGATVVEALSATLHEQPPALAGDAVVVALDRVLRRALAKRPGERPSSAAEMATEMEQIAAAGTPNPASVARPLTRLVVLPFRLLRPDPEIDFLSFALADAVSASLAGMPSVVIRSSAAAARFATDSPDLKALAAQADVDRVVMGTLLRAGEQLRATTQLVEAPAGTLVSSQTLQAPLGDVFRLQDELAQRIVESLSPSLAGREGAEASRHAGEREGVRVLPAGERGPARLVTRDGGAGPLSPVRGRGPVVRAGVGQARPLPPPARQVLPRPPGGEPRPRRRGLPARPGARSRAARGPQGLRAPRGRDGTRPGRDGAAPPPRPLDPQRPRDLRRPRPRLPVLRPARGLRGGASRGATPGPAHLDERRLHVVGPRRDGAGDHGDVRRRRLRAADHGASRPWGGRTRPVAPCRRASPRSCPRSSRLSGGPSSPSSIGGRRPPRCSPSSRPRIRTPRPSSCSGPARPA